MTLFLFYYLGWRKGRLKYSGFCLGIFTITSLSSWNLKTLTTKNSVIAVFILPCSKHISFDYSFQNSGSYLVSLKLLGLKPKIHLSGNCHKSSHWVKNYGSFLSEWRSAHIQSQYPITPKSYKNNHYCGQVSFCSVDLSRPRTPLAINVKQYFSKLNFYLISTNPEII